MNKIATSEKTLVSPGGAPIKSKAKAKKDAAVSKEEAMDNLAKQLPEVEDAYESGILKADGAKKIEEHSTVVLFVMSLGDLAYKDKDRFPSGPWCKEGDFVITRAYSGTRIKIHGKEFRIINDDTVEAVVSDPRGYARA